MVYRVRFHNEVVELDERFNPKAIPNAPFGLSLFSHRVAVLDCGCLMPQKQWTVSETTTGANLLPPTETRKEAVANTKTLIEQLGEERVLKRVADLHMLWNITKKG